MGRAYLPVEEVDEDGLRQTRIFAPPIGRELREEDHNLKQPRRSPASAVFIAMGIGFVLVCGSVFGCMTMVGSHAVSDQAVGPYLGASCLGVVVFVSACVWGVVAFFQGRL